MITALITNFAIIFTFTITVYGAFQAFKQSKYSTRINSVKLSIICGICFGLIGLLITLLFYGEVNSALVNTRFISFLIGGFIGGPITMFVAGIVLFVGRLLIGIQSIESWIFAINAFVCSMCLVFITKKHPITLKNMPIYFSIMLCEIALLMIVIYPLNEKTIVIFIVYFFYSILLYTFLHLTIALQADLVKNAFKSRSLKKRDFLTQLPNSVALENLLNDYIARKIPFEFIHIDIDLFKNFNLANSYQAGDLLLSQVAQTIREHAEQHHVFAARIGGDEFCCILTKSTPANALIEGYNLCKKVENSVYYINGQPIQATVSASIVSYPENGTTLNEIYVASNYALKIITETNVNSIKHINQIKQSLPYY